MTISSRNYARWMVGISAGLFAFGAAAADMAPAQVAPVVDEVISSPSPWQVRVRALGVITKDSGSVDQSSAYGLEYSDTVIPEVDISYFFTDNIAAELILGTTYAKINTTGAADLDVGKAWLLPPTLTLQYHFTDLGAFKPYVGAGINYSMFYNQSDKGGFKNLDVKNDFGWALQAGFDYMLDEHWGLNFDVKKIFLETDWKVDNSPLGVPLSGKAKIDPWLIGAGVTYRF
ncbi:OmpW/AlkL family protein [Aliirhizobium cellulosilyticum]|uniref:Outer membrane protein n=1 Tax=Aliirhizobium cellulosilyticum TaxID=393664 RepID=A0A7W6UWF0_9HYPH|nr:OmpW family protein [Rhizobium cellulosilyticum]MBB4346675.1 outer membrane protein [Rhizobium cellulosilyticum]MBB4410931.1 outer membrane protein [Rhizobium cellulosilyticum]MBB4445619.1 outer membrane protein [Rhizobium cellulosilyticum]